MTYCFRIRFALGTTVGIVSDDREWVLASQDSHGVDVVMRPGDSEELGSARQLVVRGSAFDSEAAALAAGQRWMSTVQAAFARMAIGADFGERAAFGRFTEAGLRMLEAQNGGRFLNDVQGLSVFECEPPPTFARSGPATGRVGKPGAAVLNALRAAVARNVTLTPQEQLAYDLYSASFNETSADARFVMLMMALETLLPEVERPQVVLAHVERLIEMTEEADLPDGDRRSLVGSLRWLRLQSINQAGRRLAQDLSDRTYMAGQPSGPESATKFFTRCYEMRSALVHGHYPRPGRDDVSVRAAQLEVFVGHLLAGELRGLDPYSGDDR
jgi:hypothetical protein